MNDKSEFNLWKQRRDDNGCIGVFHGENYYSIDERWKGN